MVLCRSSPLPFTLTLTLALTLVSLAPAQRPTAVPDAAPILNWRLPSFTPEGHREWLVRGSEARLLGPAEVDVTGISLTVFTADATNRTRTILLSPSARFFPESVSATGRDVIRVIDDKFEASGTGWSYRHREKRISIAKNVRVVFQVELKDLLQ